MSAPIAVSMGDPAGVGLEIAVKAWVARRERPGPPFLLYAHPGAVARASARLGLGTVHAVATPKEAMDLFAEALPLVPIAQDVEEIPGQPDPALAGAIIAAISEATAATAAGAASALVTLPIAKHPLYAAGFPHPGHTEFVAALTADLPVRGPRGPVMLLANRHLRVALVTIHTPLAEVAARITIPRILDVARVVAHALQTDFGIARPRIALAGLNPHAGEDGALGQEERAVINPAAAILRAEGWDVTDAIPADALFTEVGRSGFDAAIAMYHDQGLAPLKALDFFGAVNVTSGLPIVRTSPDHGTAYAIAGQGVARPDSFQAALELAAAMASRRSA